MPRRLQVARGIATMSSSSHRKARDRYFECRRRAAQRPNSPNWTSRARKQHIAIPSFFPMENTSSGSGAAGTSGRTRSGRGAGRDQSDKQRCRLHGIQQRRPGASAQWPERISKGLSSMVRSRWEGYRGWRGAGVCQCRHFSGPPAYCRGQTGSECGRYLDPRPDARNHSSIYI